MINIPNAITSIRLLCALTLVCLCTVGAAQPYFVSLFVVAGLSDMLDGYIARRFNWCTEFGARLDSVSDLTLYLSVAWFLWLNAHSDVLACSAYLFAGLSLQAIHIIYSLHRFGQFPSYHSTMSRLSAYLIFFATIAFWVFAFKPALPLALLFWCACSCEGLVISNMLSTARTNVSSVFLLLKERREQASISLSP